MRELRRLKDLGRYTLHARDGDIGRLLKVYFDDQDWQVRYFVVRAGSWLFGREVLLAPESVDNIDDERRSIEVALTCEQIRNSPPVEDHAPVSRHYERELYRHYEWEPYWGGDPLVRPDTVPPPSADDQPVRAPANPHLRSSDEVIGYRIRAEDGTVGELRDLILEEPTWRIGYLDVGTGSWLLGKEVLIACAWLEAIDWSTKEVGTVLTRGAIKSAPPYDARKVIGRDYEIALYKHYGRHFEADD
jgi:hypothetical protein